MDTKKSLNPNQVFVAISSTREEIAKTLNDILESEGWDAPKFAPDDIRLTDAVCQDIVDGTQSAFCDVDEVVDIEYTYHKQSLASLLDVDPEENEIEGDE